MHGAAWILLTFYATDYLPPLAIRATVGTAAAQVQFLVGYLTMGLVCLLLGASFGLVYRPAIERSPFPWRWGVFPLLLALALIQAPDSGGLLSRGLEALTLLSGEGLGYRWGPGLRRWLGTSGPRPSDGPPPAGTGCPSPEAPGPLP